MSLRLLVIPGSTRTAAFSKQLANAVPAALPPGASATVIDLRDYSMPLYDGDLEDAEGLPAGTVKLREVVKQHDALLFVSPEYNSSIPAVLKNTIDWLSRPYAAEPKVSVFAGKVAGLLSSSPGALGGLRGLVHLRQVLMNVGLLVVTEQFALGSAHQAFSPDGSLANDRHRDSVAKVVHSVVHVATAMAR